MRYYKFVRVFKDGRRVSSFASGDGTRDSSEKFCSYATRITDCPIRTYKANRITSDVKGGKGIWLIKELKFIRIVKE